ncbi:MAG TPA: prepilin-type N-terminal cleavage/methylation domain-containing protein [Verrucomicrobiae bacterium]|nr:prepilin-type N-terminal cleavage/methylation domain-containing protein [Verrucomicrobiae bacterium]
MLVHKERAQQGFTLVELMISMVIMAIVGLMFLVFFKSVLFDYLDLQEDASSLTQLSSQEMRIATVLRGLTQITSASTSSLTMYSYFYPSDSYESLVNYYLQAVNGTTALMASVTPMTANPPIGTPITSEEQTYTIISNYYQASGSNLFNYLDANGNQLSLPISDLETVKGIQVDLATPLSNGKDETLQVQVSLRNTKTNL